MSEFTTEDLKSQKASAELPELFNQALGITADNVDIAMPKYKTLRKLIGDISNAMQITSTSPFFAQPQFDTPRLNTALYAANTQTFLDQFPADMPHDTSVEIAQFAKKYADLKNSIEFAQIVALRAVLEHYDTRFADGQIARTILNMPGPEWAPFDAVPSLNFKEIFCECAGKTNTEMFFVIILTKLHSASKELVNTANQPDINIDAFVEIILERMESLKKVPELSRCNRAFRKIQESVNLLRNNFCDYYRDFRATNSSTIIFEHFVLDVGKSTGKTDPKLTGQFRKIIMYYKKCVERSGGDSRLKSIFAVLGKTDESAKPTVTPPQPAEIDQGSGESSAE